MFTPSRPPAGPVSRPQCQVPSEPPDCQSAGNQSSGDTIDDAEEAGSVIAHFTADGSPILLEILDASEFLSASIGPALRAWRTNPERSALALVSGV
jgi:hypothetical protein